jgi:hypothetical protein
MVGGCESSLHVRDQLIVQHNEEALRTSSLHVLTLNHWTGWRVRARELANPLMRQNKLIKRHKHGIYAGLSEERNKKARREKQEAKDKRKTPGQGQQQRSVVILKGLLAALKI